MPCWQDSRGLVWQGQSHCCSLMVPGGEEVSGGSWVTPSRICSTCHNFFHINSTARTFTSAKGLQDSLAPGHILLSITFFPVAIYMWKILPLHMPPRLPTTPMKEKPYFLQKPSLLTFAWTAMRTGDVLGGGMFPVEKDHITEVYLCLLLCCASSFSSQQTLFLCFRPYCKSTCFTLCWGPNSRNTCNLIKSNKTLYFYFAGMGGINSLTTICKWHLFSLIPALPVLTVHWQTFMCSLTMFPLTHFVFPNVALFCTWLKWART